MFCSPCCKEESSDEETTEEMEEEPVELPPDASAFNMQAAQVELKTAQQRVATLQAEIAAQKAREIAAQQARAQIAQIAAPVKSIDAPAMDMDERNRVFVRFRPLVGEELKRGDQELRLDFVASTEGHSVIVHRTDKSTAKVWTGEGFYGVFDGTVKNASVYEVTVKPMIAQVMAGRTACCFCYGHTGSGKTHTVLGYGPEKGLFTSAAEGLFMTFGGMSCPPGVKICVRFAELHNQRVFDLLNNREECNIREGEDGEVHIRKGTQVLPNGKIRVEPLSERQCTTPMDVSRAVADAIRLRAVGSSSLHDQSSRSHAILELELATDEMLAARNEVLIAESEYRRDAGPWAIKKAGEALAAAREAAARAQMRGPAYAGGLLVFVDLAGAEYGSEASAKEHKQTPQELREAKEINSSLLALKEVMRALGAGGGRGRVPFRSSKLTMLMRKHLLGENSTTCMIANASPSSAHCVKTVNTLSYAQLVAQASKKSRR